MIILRPQTGGTEMTEKYKIYIPEDMKSRLMNDAELFEFMKKDGSINLNAFLKELLIKSFLFIGNVMVVLF